MHADRDGSTLRTARLRRGVLRAIAGGMLAIALCACHPGSTAIVEGRPYPSDVPPGPTLDIQVVREGTVIRFTNTTARALGPFTMWLNARFYAHVDGLGVGQTRELSLKTFKDRWGDPFRAGGFFATQRPELLAKAEIEPDASESGTARELLGLVVVRGEE